RHHRDLHSFPTRRSSDLALTLNTLNVTGHLNTAAGGPISDAGAVTVGGATTLAGGAGNNITLSQADDFVGPVNFVSGKDVSLNRSEEHTSELQSLAYLVC